MRNFTWNRFPIKNLLIDSLLTPIVESTYLKTIAVTHYAFLRANVHEHFTELSRNRAWFCWPQGDGIIGRPYSPTWKESVKVTILYFHFCVRNLAHFEFATIWEGPWEVRFFFKSTRRAQQSFAGRHCRNSWPWFCVRRPELWHHSYKHKPHDNTKNAPDFKTS